jgi:hypothetical protein
VNAPGPVVAASDGGIVDAGDDGEILDSDTGGDENDDGRPDECGCDEFELDVGLPCWPCYREGHDTPAGAE